MRTQNHRSPIGGLFLFMILCCIGTGKLQACNLYLSIYGKDTICENTAYSYSASYGSGFSYSWSSSGTINSGSSSQSVNVEFGGTGSQTLTVIVYDSYSSCYDTLTVGVYVVASPFAFATASKYSICTGESTTLYAKYNSGATYEWKDGSGNSLSTSSSYVVSPSSTTTYYLTETSPAGCTGNGSVTITVVSTIYDSIIGPAKACLNSIRSYSAASTSNNYTWNVSGGSITNKTDTPEVKIFWKKIGQNTITLSRKIGNCNYYASLTVNVDSVKPVVIMGNTKVCVNTGLSYVAEDSNGSNYNWRINGGKIISGNNTPRVKVIWDTTASIGTLYLAFTESGGCNTSIKLNANLGRLPAKPRITGSAAACVGGVLEYYQANSGASAYNWLVNGQSVKTGTDSTIVVDFSIVGGNTVSIIESYKNTCKDTFLLNVQVSKLTKMTISGPSGNACLDTALAYTCTNSIGAKYNWLIRGGLISSGQGTNAVMVKWSDSGLTNGSLRVLTKGGQPCTDSNSGAISIPLAKSLVAKPLIDTSNGQLKAYNNSSYTYTSYQWFYNGNPVFGNTAIYKPSKSGRYYVIGINNGCFAESDEIYYTVTSGIEQDRMIKYVDIYPVPAYANLHMDIEFSGLTAFGYDVVDVMGKNILHIPSAKTGSNYKGTIDISSFRPGIYYLRITTNTGASYYKFEKL